MATLTRRQFAAAAGCGAAAAPLACNSEQRKPATDKRAIVLGLDGLDPKILQALMDTGRVPNFKKLAEKGAFRALSTTMPALSPVAWSTFITGVDPGSHGIVDFLMRDAATYAPYFSIWESRPASRTLGLGDYEIALGGGGLENKRIGVPFWAYLTAAGIPATVIKIPTNFPVDDTATRAVSGMGTPDLVDSFGMFAYYTTDRAEEYPEFSGGRVRYVQRRQGRAQAQLFGPENPIDKTAGAATVPFTVDVDPEQDAARIEIQGRRLILRQGEYSDWVRVRFDLVKWLAGVSGICRFYLKEAHPHLKLYVTPINIDPAEQAMPVTHPPEVGGEIADRIGPFWTKGLPCDTKALDYRVLDDEAYVKQAELILAERMKLFDYEWSQFREGFFFFYVSSTDQDAHMLWRNMDESHPMHAASDVRFSGYIHHLYEQMDKLVGKALSAVDDDTLLIVCSDHGFAPFGRQFHLNTWLREQGYLKIKDEAARKEKTSLADIDWRRTAAYGLGFNGLYINRLGREGQGFVGDGEADRLAARIAGELRALADDETGRRPVHRVYAREEVYSGEFTSDMPELLVGYTPGYRASSDSVQGNTGKEILNVNPWAWAGDHSMARELVPGCLLASRPLAAEKPDIIDLPATILDFFGIAKPYQMSGRILL